MNLPPITIDDRPPPHKRVRYAPDMLPGSIYVYSENSVSILTTPSDSTDLLPNDDPNNLHVMKKDVPLKGRGHIGYCCRKYGLKICYKKTRFYCSTCSDEDKKFYYCQGFSSITVTTRNCFLEHQDTMSLVYGRLLCLSPFRPLLYLLNLFCACFLSVPLITPCIVFFYFLNVCDDSLVG